LEVGSIEAYEFLAAHKFPVFFLYLEILPLTRTQINLLEGFHWKSIRYMQSLPQRTAVSAVYLLIGAYPVELQKKFLHCHNSTKFASIPLLWFFHYGKTVGSTATIIVSDGFLPQQGMHRSASTIWSFKDRLPWNKRNWSNNCISNIQELCLATNALWSGHILSVVHTWFFLLCLVLLLLSLTESRLDVQLNLMAWYLCRSFPIIRLLKGVSNSHVFWFWADLSCNDVALHIWI
jgi:hypothetical protein